MIRAGICICTALLFSVTPNLLATASFLAAESHKSFSLDYQYQSKDDYSGYGLKTGFHTKRKVGFGIGYAHLKGAGIEDGKKFGLYLTKDTPSRIQSLEVNYAIELASELSATRESDAQYWYLDSYTLSNSIAFELSAIPGSQQGFRYAPQLGILLVHEQQRIDAVGIGKLEQTTDLDAFATLGLRMCLGSSMGSMLVLEPQLMLGGSDTEGSVTIGYLGAFAKKPGKKPYVKPSRWKTD